MDFKTTMDHYPTTIGFCTTSLDYWTTTTDNYLLTHQLIAKGIYYECKNIMKAPAFVKVLSRDSFFSPNIYFQTSPIPGSSRSSRRNFYNLISIFIEVQFCSKFWSQIKFECARAQSNLLLLKNCTYFFSACSTHTYSFVINELNAIHEHTLFYIYDILVGYVIYSLIVRTCVCYYIWPRVELPKGTWPNEGGTVNIHRTCSMLLWCCLHWPVVTSDILN
jgi:hypothetical protein